MAKVRFYDEKRTGIQTMYKKEFTEIRYIVNSKRGMSQDHAQDYIRNLIKKSRKLKNKNFFINTYYGHGCRSSKFNTDINHIDIYDPRLYYEEERFNDRVYQFSIIYVDKPAEEGGNDPHNNCLWNCLLKAYNGKIPHFTKPWKMKSRLGLERDDKIPVEKVKDLEDIIKCRINIIGDYEYQSVKEYSRKITIKLNNSHYTLMEGEATKILTRGISKRGDKDIIVYRMDHENGKILTYGENGDGEITTDQLAENKNNPITAKYILLKCNKNEISLKDFYEDFIKRAEEIKEITNEKIDLFMCGGKYKLTALNLFHNMTRVINPDPIDSVEAKWLTEAFVGGIEWCKACELENGYSFDVNSMYSYIMMSIQVPIRKGEFVKLEKIGDIIEYGIYRCAIHKSNNDIFDKLFRFHYNGYDKKKEILYGYYTHFDIKAAIKIGLKVELIKDDQPNCLRYGKGTRISGKSMFGEYIEFLYPFKKNPEFEHLKSDFKMLLNVLWGALCQHYVISQKSNETNPITLESPPISIIRFGNSFICKSHNKERAYRTNYARVGCFITAAARRYMSNIMKNYSENIVKIHTDGFITDKEINVELSNELGGLKNDHKGKCQIGKINRKAIWN